MVTRCPIKIDMVKESIEKEYFEFNDPNIRIYDVEKVREEIKKRTELIAPKNTVSNKTISVKYHSNDTINLTLVDLPGLILVPKAHFIISYKIFAEYHSRAKARVGETNQRLDFI